MAKNQAVPNTLRFDLRLVVRHPTLDPGLISARLGLTPRMTQMSGKPRVGPTGAALAGTYRESRWAWSTRVEGKREFFDEVNALAERLQPQKRFLSEIIDGGGKIDLGIEVFPDLK